MKGSLSKFEKQLLAACGVLVCVILVAGCSARGDVYSRTYQPTPAPAAAPSPAQPQVIVIESGPAPAPIIMPPDYAPLAVALVVIGMVFVFAVLCLAHSQRPKQQTKVYQPPQLSPGQIDQRIILIASKSDSELAALGYDPAQVRAAVAQFLPRPNQIPPARQIGGGR